MARQHEHRVVVRWVVAPPTLPFLVGPRSADRPEHVAPHDRGPVAGRARDHEPLVNALLAALLAHHATAVTRAADPPLVDSNEGETPSTGEDESEDVPNSAKDGGTWMGLSKYALTNCSD